jgi:phytoene dehydrogenase-like protein
VHDVCSSIHPLAVGSPFFVELGLDLEWVHPDAPAAHPFDDGTALALERDLGATAAALGPDENAYRSLMGPLVEAWPYPYSPRILVALRHRLGAALSDARDLAERFRDPRTKGWFTGFAAHSMPWRRPIAGFGLALLTLGHTVGGPSRAVARSASPMRSPRNAGLGGDPSGKPDDERHCDVVLADVYTGAPTDRG